MSSYVLEAERGLSRSQKVMVITSKKPIRGQGRVLM